MSIFKVLVMLVKSMVAPRAAAAAQNHALCQRQPWKCLGMVRGCLRFQFLFKARGGGWMVDAWSCCSAFRCCFHPAGRGSMIDFRPTWP